MRTATLLVVCALVLSAAVPAAAVGSETATPAATEANATQTESTTVTILSYNDVQTAMAQNGSVPRLATLLEQRRAAHDNPTFTFGAGDEVSPHSMSPISQWRTPVKVLNEMQPDAEVVGNHDLDYGFGAVSNYSNASEFPWLLANVVDSETGETVPGTEPYEVFEKGGVKVGVVGLVDEKIKSKTAVDFQKQGYELRDYSEVGSEYATMLKEEKNVDVVVTLGHFGVPVAKEFANSTENVDVVLVGDDEIAYEPKATDGVVISEAAGRAAYLSELNLTVENGEVTKWNGRLVETDENVTKDSEVSNIIADARSEQLSRVAGKTTTELDARFSSNYHDETALGNLITDAFRWQTDADVAITNAGGIRSNAQYGPGNLTAGDVYNVLPFNNHLVTVELTGSELEALLQSQVVTLESETGQQYGAEAQLQVSGVTYEWLGHERASDQIRSLYVNGDPVDPDATYTVTVNSYMAGWDGSVLENATRTGVDYTMYGEVVYDYVADQGTVSPTDANRIRRIDYETDAGGVELDGEGSVTVTFEKPTAANNTVVNSRSFHALNSENERVNATSASVEDGTVSVTFEDGALRTLAESGDVEVYGNYVVDRPERPYFENSVVNAEVDASLVEQSTTTQSTTESTTTTENTTNATTEDESGGDTPGFGVGVALAAVLGAALVAVRRA
ncbi:bifunctional metallophosphatase/5'-nucleotidase [Halobacterium litoreum]|uniref:Bifunctional metallophosphatase/5'-nucleotidase n=1 Tax=Halobacterium litoreum TaxID=2039234 RepID=A0ABD5NCT3_9EURY|nr:bifunctional UDP-sugar hydrolase/5'-nucleotidase [Halobacterium litoreum]UHH14315.1 bifunctional metallophosphatase/5'-nucleotidase [Halobacterium litoreum]